MLFYSCTTLLTLLCLGGIWGIDFMPMQDYPQHLFLAQVNATFSNSLYNWPQFYETALQIGPYSLFYLLIILCAKFTPILIAGKLFISIYILLITTLVLIWNNHRHSEPAWGSLLLFPLAFHQMYFMGFTNFIFSIPLVFIAMIDFKQLCDAPSAKAAIRHLLIIGLLFLCHPYTILVYIGLTLADACCFRLPKKQPVALIAPILIAIIFMVWYFSFAPAGSGKMPLSWWPWQDVAAYYLLFFNNMNLGNGINWGTALPWIVIIITGLCCVINSIRSTTKTTFSKRFLLFFILVTIGFAVLPFWAGKYSYFNLRLAPLSYFCAALLFGSFIVSQRIGLCITALAAFLTVQSATMQTAVSHETAEIQPLLAKMNRNAKLLPLMFKTDSNILDKKFFPEAHAHDYFYYHLIVGGGASPNLFPSPMLPLRLRKDVKLPQAAHGFSWQEQGQFYDYILTRESPDGFQPFIQRYTTLSGISGKWMLFSNHK